MAKNGGPVFSAVCGSKLIPISVPEPYKHRGCSRLLFFDQPGTFPLPHIYTPHPPSAPSRAFPAGRLLVKMYSDQCPRTVWAQRMLWGACFCLSHSLFTVFTSLQCPMQLFVQSGQIGFLMGAIQISFEFGMLWKERMGCVYVGQRKSTRLVKKK